jgi:hypothetical protein
VTAPTPRSCPPDRNAPPAAPPGAAHSRKAASDDRLHDTEHRHAGTTRRAWWRRNRDVASRSTGTIPTPRGPRGRTSVRAGPAAHGRTPVGIARRICRPARRACARRGSRDGVVEHRADRCSRCRSAPSRHHRSTAPRISRSGAPSPCVDNPSQIHDMPGKRTTRPSRGTTHRVRTQDSPYRNARLTAAERTTRPPGVRCAGPPTRPRRRRSTAASAGRCRAAGRRRRVGRALRGCPS